VLAFRPLWRLRRASCASGVYGGVWGVTANGWPLLKGRGVRRAGR
jgi:hypothetical protein